MKNSFHTEIIFNEQENKAQGVLMTDTEPDYIPEIVGLTKVQLAFLIFFSIFLGLAAFGLGSYINGNSFIEAKKKESAYKKILLDNTHNQQKDTYVLFGVFSDQEQSKLLQTKIQTATDKSCLLIQKENGVQVVLGPFISEEMALNEMRLIEYRTQVSGSLIHEI